MPGWEVTRFVWCEQCGEHPGTMLIDDEWICEWCTSGIRDEDEDYPGFGDEEPDSAPDSEHDPDCPCEQCQEERIEVATAFDMGVLP